MDKIFNHVREKKDEPYMASARRERVAKTCVEQPPQPGKVKEQQEQEEEQHDVEMH
ncbi:hypothetical protein A2U01_0098996 [Trifolium medium]|nr:hypothetical protein [Trifolium medium]